MVDQNLLDEIRKGLCSIDAKVAECSTRLTSLEQGGRKQGPKGLSNNPNERVVIFIDHSNFFGTARNTFAIDYVKMRDFLVNGRIELDTRFYYSEQDPSTLDQVGQQRRAGRDRFYYWLRRQGFNLIELRRVQREGCYVEKGVDTEIVADMMEVAKMPNVDTIILVSGDGDYSRTIRRIRCDYYRRVEVAFFGESTSNELLGTGNGFVDLTSHISVMQRDIALPNVERDDYNDAPRHTA